MGEKEKIRKYLEIKGLSKNSFYTKTGLSVGFLDSGNSLGADKVKIIINAYPDISLEWLVMGEGEMIKTAADERPASPVAKRTKSGGIPLIPTNAMAGFLTGGYDAILELDCEQYIIPIFKGAEFLIPVKGESMQPRYNSGDVVACKKVTMGRFFQWNKIYVLDTEQGALIKRVHKGSSNDTLTLVSDNKDFEPFEIARAEIFNIAIVVGAIRLE